MTGRNAMMTRQHASEPAASSVRKPSFSQSRTKASPNKRTKQSLIPVRSLKQDHPKAHPSCNYETQWPEKNGASYFPRSGPSVDRVSSPVLSDVESPSLSSQAPKRIQRNSGVTKYIDRFRYGQPLSREERQQMFSDFEDDRVPLWWMSSSSLPPSSTPSKISHKDPTDDRSQAVSSPARRQLHDDFNYSPRGGDYIMNAYLPSDTSENEFEDTEILHLQERASKLLQRRDSILSSVSIPVSSEGLGCSDRSSSVSINETAHRPLMNTSIKSTAATGWSDSALAVPVRRYTFNSSMSPHTRPEDDILSQWRLRRKMEQAGERVHSMRNSEFYTPTFKGRAPSLHFSSVNGHPCKQEQIIQYPKPPQEDFPEPKEARGERDATSVPLGAAEPDTFVSRPPSLAHVPAHMHLLCDILPCPTQSPHAVTFQGNPHKAEETLTEERTEKPKVSGHLKDNYIDNPPHRHIPSPPPGPSRYTHVDFTFRPTDGGHPSRPREGCSPARPVEGDCPTRLTKDGHPSSIPKKEGSHSRLTEERNQSRLVVRDHDQNLRVTNEMPEKEKTQTKQEGESEKTERITTKQKKFTRCAECTEHAEGPKATSSAQQKPPKKNKTRADPRQQQRRKDAPHQPPLSSPVQRALGQVVSEVLFPPVDSSPRGAAVPSLPPPRRSSLPPCAAHASLEVMSQLLQEAEDEKEFEDDTLLRVLRTQRNWVKEQISEVDFMLHNKQEDKPT
ncbi:proline and serine-rich protein 3 isoform X2 [Syngnathoides biaculeatus]|uniref:proline and serine-rich protein 3 isoform X2 n=1 Tax=Syngnathoides biaculeatus TaxID=300417 RepID=UPI002ADDFC9C|nr:proline and serine-rich protein 3 isoform X2 [Syngnathoides biaculeatus]